MSQKRLILGVTIGGSSRLLDGQAKHFKSLGYDVYLISQNHYKEKLFCEREGITHLPVDIVAEISPLKDIKSLIQVIRHFRSVKPDIVNVGTAKMGLLGVISAKMLSVPKIVYTCRGFRFETETGVLRKLLIGFDKLIMKLSDQVIFVSPSLKIAAAKYKLLIEHKSVVIGKGSSNGVNIEAFNKEKVNQEERQQLINEYDLSGKLVIGFVGRVTLHKGAYELVESFEKLYQENDSLRLILMGHIKCDEKFEQRFLSHPGIIYIPFQDNVPLYMSLFDIFVLPSWREGFPNVPIQAAAIGVPVIVSDATGCIDSVDNNVNGVIFKVRNQEDLESALRMYINKPELRQEFGKNGIAWARNFSKEEIWSGIQKVYEL